ncbi:TPA: SLATT domain-containing protein [Vibrio parahaemolyticus]|uniref:SLATT domain-containing protein n=1 Tax=Vibrio parahaemolyticus TaxID=670 RepID=UPI0004DB8FBC|nr:SLATT domain-containing protein [Vibrio parahaemolyticus]ALG52073.1 hypothetical protein FORC6_1747 [Vibrio parahaemolyticus]MBE3928667.1 SLATT domain-containing protein [Vibrio parahaemolyticus]MBE4030806.1 SLATT domain-containing protein [Vibrio parahaemolyticus]MBE4107718.1 SLATT domain-containing protein [Vibrio parahaemolyticus]MBM4819339.1 SLATT domain-containing protein [Vibrio parahaemolyticus]
MLKSKEKLLELWCKKCSVSKTLHYKLAENFRRVDFYLRGFVVIMSACTGAEVLKAFQDLQYVSEFTLIFGLLLSISAAILSGLGLGAKAEIHRSYGASFSDIEKRCSVLLTKPTIDDQEIEDLRIIYSEVVRDAPNTSTLIYRGWKKRNDGKEEDPKSEA